jgi:hypothetical protein
MPALPHPIPGVVLRLIIATSLLSGAVLAGDAPYGHETVYRYRCFEGSQPSWVSPITSAGGIDHSAGSADIHVIERGSGFDRYLTTDFNGSSEYIRSAASVNTVDTANHDSFTIQSWFLAQEVSGYRTLISNTESNRGFSLKVKDGQLRGLVRLDDNGSVVHAEILGGTVVPGHWTRAAFRVKENSTYYDLRLFQDGALVAQLNFPHYDGVRQSTETPVVGAEPNGGAGTDHFFDGYLYAASITNYAVGTSNFLENDLVRDGSRYFGLGSYHDYLDTTEAPDHRISETINTYPDVADHVTRRQMAPFLNDRYVPQGVATDGVDRIFLTYYWRHESGEQKEYPSILVEMRTSGELVRVMQLYRDINGGGSTPMDGHVGGVAYWNGKIYIPDEEDILRYDLDQVGSYTFDPDTFANPRGDQNPLYPDVIYEGCFLGTLNTSISYLSVGQEVDGTAILWTGAFDEHDQRNLIGFAIDAAGGIDHTTASHVFKLPEEKVQGIDQYAATCTGYWFLTSHSWGGKWGDHSHVRWLRYDAGQTTPVAQGDLFELPSGLEDFAMLGDELWSISESGAKYYQKRTSPWEQLFPFVFAMNVGSAGIGVGGLGSQYCSATPNSSGVPGSINAYGSASIAEDDFTLTATDLPSGQFGYFVVSRDTGFAQPPGSQGYLCLGGDIGRLNKSHQVIVGPGGCLKLNLGDVPVHPPVAVQPGETWQFQCWYRDKNPRQTSNFTFGLTATFELSGDGRTLPPGGGPAGTADVMWPVTATSWGSGRSLFRIRERTIGPRDAP